MAIFDELADKQRGDQSKEWIYRAFDAQKEIAEFVAQRARCKAKGIVGWFAGSYNFCFRVRFEDGAPDAIIRFPRPGCTVFRDEKIANEVQVIEFILEKTTILIPRLISWGLTKDSPRQLGPFMISEFVKGVSLSSVLRDPADPDRQSLRPDIDNRTLDTIYEQIADIMLQLFQFNFTRIGAVSKDSTSNTWSVSRRPLTYRMNELATTAFFATNKFPIAPFESTSDFFQSLAHENIIHLQTQRNLATDESTARDLYIARHQFVGLIDKYCVDNHGPFKLFCDDLRPHNILIDPDTLRFTAVMDLEFTNAMPSQFSSDPPWWLLLEEPELYLGPGYTPGEFVTAYEPRLQQFLQAMRRAEKARGMHHAKMPLSSLMRDAWDTKRFWFNYAARNPFDVEAVSANYLNEGRRTGLESLSEEARAGMEPFIQMKMKQLTTYDGDCKMILG